MSTAMRATLSKIAAAHPTAIVTGRSRNKIRDFVQLDTVIYAASHGFDITAPDPSLCPNSNLQVANEFLPSLARARDELDLALRDIEGAHVEDNGWCVSVHWR